MYFFSRKLFFFDHHAIQGENPKVSKRPVVFLSDVCTREAPSSFSNFSFFIVYPSLPLFIFVLSVGSREFSLLFVSAKKMRENVKKKKYTYFSRFVLS